MEKFGEAVEESAVAVDGCDGENTFSDNIICDAIRVADEDGSSEELRRCPNCHTDNYWVLTESDLVCPNCGHCDSSFVPLAYNLNTVADDKKSRGFCFTSADMSCSIPSRKAIRAGDVIGGGCTRREGCGKKHSLFAVPTGTPEEVKFIMSIRRKMFARSGVGYTGRYRREQHYLLRVVNPWRGKDAVDVPDDILERAKDIAETGKYGSPDHLGRAAILKIAQEAGMKRNRQECWRTFYRHIVGPIEEPPDELVQWCLTMYPKLLTAFSHVMHYKRQEPGAGKRFRKSFISADYAHRKLLEIRGIRRFHWQFPIMRCHAKVRALDEIMAEMCDYNDLRGFSSTVLFKK